MHRYSNNKTKVYIYIYICMKYVCIKLFNTKGKQNV